MFIIVLGITVAFTLCSLIPGLRLCRLAARTPPSWVRRIERQAVSRAA